MKLANDWSKEHNFCNSHTCRDCTYMYREMKDGCIYTNVYRCDLAEIETGKKFCVLPNSNCCNSRKTQEQLAKELNMSVSDVFYMLRDKDHLDNISGKEKNIFKQQKENKNNVNS